jgi:hypothetical protein
VRVNGRWLRTLAVRWLWARALARAWRRVRPVLPAGPEVLAVGGAINVVVSRLRQRLEAALDRLGEPLRMRTKRSLLVLRVDVEHGLVVERRPRRRPRSGGAAWR